MGLTSHCRLIYQRCELLLSKIATHRTCQKDWSCRGGAVNLGVAEVTGWVPVSGCEEDRAPTIAWPTECDSLLSVADAFPAPARESGR